MSLKQKFTEIYLIAFLLMVLFISISQWLVQTLILERKEDSHFVDLAGRQRMLSRDIVKNCLLLSHDPNRELIDKVYTETKHWEQAHRELFKSAENTEQTIALYQKLNPVVENIHIQIFAILKNTKDLLALKNLLAQDEAYVDLMNRIVEQMAEDSQTKIEQLQKVEFILAVLCVLLLLSQGEFIFRPLASSFSKYLDRMEKDSLLIKKQKDELEMGNEALKQNIEELNVSQNGLLVQKQIIEEQRIYQKAILDNAAFMIVTVSPTGFISSLNPAAEATLGYKAEELISKAASVIFHDPAQIRVFWYKIIVGISSLQESAWVRKDGTTFPVSLSITALHVENAIIGYMGIAEDISEKNAQKDLLKRKNERLLSTQEILKAEAEKLKTALVRNRAITGALDKSALRSVCDKRGLLTQVNALFCEISGYTETELIGKDHQVLSSGYHEKNFWGEMWETIQNGKTWRNDVCNRSKDGSLFWTDMVISPVVDQQGNIYQYLSIMYLITERKNSEKIIQLQNEELFNSLEKMTVLQQKGKELTEKTKELLKKVTDSINYALRIQSAIMPKESELQKYFDCFVFFKPKDIVSGDFYWFADRHDKKIVVLADCTGHGVPGAFMTIIGNNILNQIVYDYEMYHPDEIINIMPILLSKALLYSEGEVKDGMEVGILTIYEADEKSEKIEFAGSKSSLFYVQNQEFFEIKGDRRTIDGNQKDDYEYQRHSIMLKPNEKCTFYLSSDGYQDQFSQEHRRKFYSAQLKDLLFKISEEPLNVQKEILSSTLDAWQGNEMQRDDITILGITRLNNSDF